MFFLHTLKINFIFAASNEDDRIACLICLLCLQNLLNRLQ